MNAKKQKEEMLLASCQLLIHCMENITFGELLEFSRIVIDAQHPVKALFLEARKLQTVFFEYMATEKGKVFAALFKNNICCFDSFNDLVVLNHTMVGRSREISSDDPLWNAWVEMKQILVSYTKLRINIETIRVYVMEVERSKPLIAHGNIVESIGKNMADIDDESAWDNIIAIAQMARGLLVEKKQALAKNQ